MNSKSLWIFGSTSTIIQPVLKKYPNATTINRGHNFYHDPKCIVSEMMSTEGLTLIYNSAILYSKPISAQTDSEIETSLFINLIRFIQLIEILNNNNKCFRAIYIGSEVSQKGSFDTTYWMTKAFAEKFVAELKLTNPKSSIVAVSPSTIENSAMTKRRDDRDRLEKYKSAHPKNRFLKSEEVSSVLFALLELTDYLSNTTIHLNGGKFARR